MSKIFKQVSVVMMALMLASCATAGDYLHLYQGHPQAVVACSNSQERYEECIDAWALNESAKKAQQYNASAHVLGWGIPLTILLSVATGFLYASIIENYY